jgi:hypothetical protein
MDVSNTAVQTNFKGNGALQIAPDAMGERGSFDGTWNITINTPGNRVQTILVIEETDAGNTGIQKGEGNEEPIINLIAEGSKASWSSRIRKPMKHKVDFKGRIHGDQITGKVKAGIFRSFHFRGQKI